jgi:hypothetical protein
VEREQLTAAQAGERGREEQHRVLLAGGGADERMNLLGGEHLDVTAAAQRGLLDVRDGVDGQSPDFLRALEDPVQEHERLRAREHVP